MCRTTLAICPLRPAPGRRRSTRTPVCSSVRGGSWCSAPSSRRCSPTSTPLTAIRNAADQILPGSGTWLLLSALQALITVITVNIYAAALELITIADSFVKVRPTRNLRVVACTIIGLAGLLGAELSTGPFLASFGSFLVILLYVLVPWTSVNLVDYYFVRRGPLRHRTDLRPSAASTETGAGADWRPTPQASSRWFLSW